MSKESNLEKKYLDTSLWVWVFQHALRKNAGSALAAEKIEIIHLDDGSSITIETPSQLTRLELILAYQRDFLRSILSPKPSNITQTPPGSILLEIADFFCSRKNVEVTFKPLVADYQYEYFEALQHKRLWKMRWIKVRYTWSFAKAMGLSKVFSILNDFRSAGK